ncbi:MAG: DUF4124 domain-containing protein [Leptospirillia bacterium]
MRKILLWGGFLLAVAIALPLVLKGADGKPLFSFSDLRAPKLPPIPTVNLPDVHLPDVHLPDIKMDSGKAEPDAPLTVYRWQDADGNWHFSDRSPDGVSAEKTEVQAANVVATPDYEEHAPATDADEDGDRGGNGMLDSVVSVYTDAPNLMDKAREAGAALEERSKALSNMELEP